MGKTEKALVSLELEGADIQVYVDGVWTKTSKETVLGELFESESGPGTFLQLEELTDAGWVTVDMTPSSIAALRKLCDAAEKHLKEEEDGS